MGDQPTGGCLLLETALSTKFPFIYTVKQQKIRGVLISLFSWSATTHEINTPRIFSNIWKLSTVFIFAGSEGAMELENLLQMNYVIN